MQVALWQPPQLRGVPEGQGAKLRGWTDGEDLQFNSNNGSITSNQAAAYTQKMQQAGIISQDDVATGKNINTSSGSESVPGSPTTMPTAISNDTGGVENLKSFPSTLQLSRHFTLGQLTESPYVWCTPYWVSANIRQTGTGGLTPGQLVANAKLLAVNTLDPIKDKFPDFAVNSTIRPYNGRSQHGKFQACDFRRSQAGYKAHYETAVWIRNNVRFDQLILEYQVGGSWIHVSYANPLTIPQNSKVLTINTQTGSTSTGLVNLDSQFRIS